MAIRILFGTISFLKLDHYCKSFLFTVKPNLKLTFFGHGCSGQSRFIYLNRVRIIPFRVAIFQPVCIFLITFFFHSNPYKCSQNEPLYLVRLPNFNEHETGNSVTLNDIRYKIMIQLSSTTNLRIIPSI